MKAESMFLNLQSDNKDEIAKVQARLKQTRVDYLTHFKKVGFIYKIQNGNLQKRI